MIGIHRAVGDKVATREASLVVRCSQAITNEQCVTVHSVVVATAPIHTMKVKGKVAGC